MLGDAPDMLEKLQMELAKSRDEDMKRARAEGVAGWPVSEKSRAILETLCETSMALPRVEPTPEQIAASEPCLRAFEAHEKDMMQRAAFEPARPLFAAPGSRRETPKPS